MATRVFYNGVVLQNVLTRMWDEEVVYDQSRTDALFHRFRFHFEGLVFLDQPPASDAAPAWTGLVSSPTGTPHDFRLPGIKSALLQPRGTLIIYIGDNEDSDLEIFRCTAADRNLQDRYRDVDNGPKPTNFNILQILGGRVARIAFAIECAKVDCLVATGTPNAPFVLNNRWSLEEEMDANAVVRRTIRGRLRLSAPIYLIGDQRTLVTIAPLERGFRRDSIRFNTDASGLECEYQVIDQQIDTAAPWPATKMEVTHNERIEDQTQLFSEIHVRLEAPIGANRGKLIQRIVQIWDARTQLFKKLASGVEARAEVFIEPPTWDSRRSL